MCNLLPFILLPLALMGAFKEGDLFVPTIFADQFDRNVSLTPSDRYLIIVFDKAGYYDVNVFVKKQKEGYLKKNRVKYINDISAMPQSILELFVKPRMQKLPYPVLLVKDENISRMLNYRDGKISIYRLQEGRIVDIDFVESDGLEDAIGQ